MAAKVILRNWRAGLLGALLLGFVLLVILALANERPSADELPLRDVPESAFASAGVVLDPVYGEDASFGPKGAEFLAGGMVCCDRPFQTVLVRLRETNGDASLLSYALNYDTSTAPDYPITGGHFTTVVNREFDYFVAFLDAKTGELIFRLQPGYQDPFPSAEQPTEPAIGPVIARNLDGPNVFVTLSTFRPETTVVECGEEEVVATNQASAGPWHVTVNDASSGKLLFERRLPAGSRKWVLSIRHDGVVGDEMVPSGPVRANLPCR